MTIIWEGGECSTKNIKGRLLQSAAYTTVVTTLRRLVKKGLLQQKKPTNYILVFSPKCSREEWQQQAAKAATETFLTTPNVPRKVLISALQEAVASRKI